MEGRFFEAMLANPTLFSGISSQLSPATKVLGLRVQSQWRVSTESHTYPAVLPIASVRSILRSSRAVKNPSLLCGDGEEC